MATQLPKLEDFNGIPVHTSSASRPPLVNHHSSSLPSTPYQRPRKLSFTSRSPSPDKTHIPRSPRSARSESESGLRSGGKGPIFTGCKYETGMAHSRRRIPYSVGGDQLERAKTVPKKYLNPPEEKKLSEDMRELYNRILPSAESDERRARLKQKLERILNEQWPGNEIKVHVFGSSGNMLCTSDSDVDICITTTMKALERVCLLAKALADHGMERVVCVPHAKVPIVKTWDPELGLACDMNVNNTLALENTRMIKTYVQIDERVRPLAMIIKHWTKRRILNDAALGGTLSSYTWICMILNFLQTRNPPVLPCLHKYPRNGLVDPNGKPSQFADDVDSLRGFGEKNNESLGELLFRFFRRYAHEIDYERSVLSVREGGIISKETKKWHLMQNNRLCVEEPFNTERNLGNTVDDISFRGVHLELRRAFDLLCEAKLEECIEQYEFPLAEERLWEKPLLKPAPVLSRSRSQSQTGRGGKPGFNSRGNRTSSGQHRTNTARRASSAAAMNKFIGPQVGARGITSQENSLQAHFQKLHLHDHLFNEYQHLQARELELRARQAQAQAQAQAQLHTQNQSPSSNMAAPIPQQTLRDPFHRSATINQASFSAPLRSGTFPYPFVYHPMSGAPHQSVHTNPSSPSMKPAQPELRRSVHRSSNTEDTSSPSLRSHSQPARPLPVGLTVQSIPPIPLTPNEVFQYQQLRQHQQLINYTPDSNYSQQRHADLFHRRQIPPDLRFEDNFRKEYVGYYVHDSPPSHPYREDPVNARAPIYNDLPNRHRGVPANFGRLITPSRSPSPSPSSSLRDRSFSVRSASSAPPGLATHDRNQNAKPGYRSSGPIIVDGSAGWGLHDQPAVTDSSLTTSRSGVTSPLEDQSFDICATSTTDTPFQTQGRRSSYGYDGLHIKNHAQPTPDLGRASRASRNGIIEPLKRRATNHVNDISFTSSTAKISDHKANGHGLGIEFENGALRQPSENERSPSQNSLTQAPTIETQTETSDPRFDKTPKPLPYLSPVREVRTPSPTTNRKDDVFIDGQHSGRFRGPLQLEIPPLSAILNGKQNQAHHPLHRSNGGLSSPSESLVNSQPTQSNGWQQPIKKSKKNKTKLQAFQQSQATSGEPLPDDEAERKGG